MGLANGAFGANGGIADEFENTQEFTDSDRWETPDWSLLHQGQMPAPRLPLQLFGPWSSWIANAARASSAPADYVAFGLLTAAASLVGNACAIRPDPERSGWSEPVGLWTVLVGAPSSGKTPALIPVEKALEDLDSQAREAFEQLLTDHMSRSAVAEEADKAWRKQVQDALKKKQEPPARPPEASAPPEIGAPRVIIRSATLEAVAMILKHSPKGILQSRDEIAGWWGDMNRYSGSSDRPAWLSTYNAGPITMDRVKFGGKPLHIPRALASVLGGTQPDRLADLLDSPDDGFTARFLYVWPDATPLKRSSTAADAPMLREAFSRLYSIQMQTAEDGALIPSPLAFTADAADLFFEFRQGTRELIGPEEGPLAGWIGKADGLVARIAGILELLDWSRRPNAPLPRIVTRLTVERASMLWTDYLLPMARRAFGDAARPENEVKAARLLKAIRQRRPEKLNAREIYKHWRLQGLREPAAVNTALIFLHDSGWILPAPTRAGDTAGRQKADWDINPELWR